LDHRHHGIPGRIVFARLTWVVLLEDTDACGVGFGDNDKTGGARGSLLGDIKPEKLFCVGSRKGVEGFYAFSCGPGLDAFKSLCVPSLSEDLGQ
jgi:hypothetical protein